MSNRPKPASSENKNKPKKPHSTTPKESTNTASSSASAPKSPSTSDKATTASNDAANAATSSKTASNLPKKFVQQHHHQQQHHNQEAQQHQQQQQQQQHEEVITSKPAAKKPVPTKPDKAPNVVQDITNPASSTEPKSKEVKPGENPNPELSKAEIKRLRKEKQEEQRAKKAAAAANKSANSETTKPVVPKPNPSVTAAATVEVEVTELASSLKSSLKVSTNESSNDQYQFITAPITLKLNKKHRDSIQNSADSSFKLFPHFDPYKRDYSITEKFLIDSPQVHPAFIKLGIQYAHENISGSNARCLALLGAIKQFIRSYKEPKRDNRTMSKDLESKLKPNINFLTQCRPLSLSMANAIKEIKHIISTVDFELTTVDDENDPSKKKKRVELVKRTESQVKEHLINEIDNFVNEKIIIASDTICKYILAENEIVISGSAYAKSKITNDDCILTFGCSSLVINVLLRAHKKFPNLKVIVVDSRPKLKGKLALEQLARHGINCTYVLINAISFVMSRVTKVLLGANGLLANGYVMSTIGTSQIALVAKSFNVPVVICCETYKFCDKVQTDAFINNELGDPNDLISFGKRFDFVSPLQDIVEEQDGSKTRVDLLNLTYDITSPEFINCVVTDMGALPCTSVPVVLRMRNRENIYVSAANTAVSHRA